jgi:tRNA A-37 threonylcarbamoyl transferase component Bud32
MTERSNREPLSASEPRLVVFAAEDAARSLAPVLRDPSAFGATVIKRNTQRAVYAVSTAAGDLIVKVHALTNWRTRLAARLGRTRARHELEIARAMRAAGIPTPAPVALLEEPERGFAASAIRAVVGATAFGTFLEARFAPNDGKSAEKRAFVARAVELLANMHRAGFDHRDFHGGNLLVDAAESLEVIDLHRVARGTPPTWRRLRALADLIHTLRFALDPGDEVHALETYWMYARPGESVAEMLPKLRDVIARREAERIRSRSKRCLVESSGFARVTGGGCRGFRRRDRGEDELIAAIAAARDQLDTGGPQCRSLARRSSVAIGEVGARRYAVKFYERDGWKHLRGRATGGRGKRAWRMANALDVRDLPIVKPIAWIQTPDRSILVTDEVESALPLHVLSFRLSAESHSVLPRTVGTAVASMVGAFFELGIRINDLSPKNVLITTNGAEARAVLCDFDGIRLNGASRKRMIAALAQLNDLAPSIPARTRLRVLRLLARRFPKLARRGTAQAIAALTALRSARELAPRPEAAVAPT